MQCCQLQRPIVARATGGVYVHVDPDESTEDQTVHIAQFANHVLSSNAERAQLELASRQDYERELLAGTAKELSWYTSVSDETKEECTKTNDKEGSSSSHSLFESIDI